MHLENIVVDALDPRALGRFWEATLGTVTLTDEPAGFETRLAVPDGPVLDLCFPRVPEPPGASARLHLDLRAGDDQRPPAERLLALGAHHAPAAGRWAPATTLVDPEGNPFLVSDRPETRADVAPVSAGAGPVGTGIASITAVALDVADPERDLEFWGWLTGWAPVTGARPHSLRHPSRRGPLLTLRSEASPKGPAKNRMHLDVRLEAGDDLGAVAQGISDRGGRELRTDWGELPWTSYTDPSGNEFCVLPSARV